MKIVKIIGDESIMSNFLGCYGVLKEEWCGDRWFIELIGETKNKKGLMHTISEKDFEIIGEIKVEIDKDEEYTIIELFDFEEGTLFTDGTRDFKIIDGEIYYSHLNSGWLEPIFNKNYIKGKYRIKKKYFTFKDAVIKTYPDGKVKSLEYNEITGNDKYKEFTNVRDVVFDYVTKVKDKDAFNNLKWEVKI